MPSAVPSLHPPNLGEYFLGLDHCQAPTLPIQLLRSYMQRIRREDSLLQQSTPYRHPPPIVFLQHLKINFRESTTTMLHFLTADIDEAQLDA